MAEHEALPDPNRVILVKELDIERDGVKLHGQEALDVIHALINTGVWKGELGRAEIATGDQRSELVPAYLMAEGETREGLIDVFCQEAP